MKIESVKKEKKKEKNKKPRNPKEGKKKKKKREEEETQQPERRKEKKTPNMKFSISFKSSLKHQTLKKLPHIIFSTIFFSQYSLIL